MRQIIEIKIEIFNRKISIFKQVNISKIEKGI